MKSLFDPVAIGTLSLKNRIVRSATHERAADENGRFAAAIAPIYATLAQNGVGTIISGMMGVGPNSRIVAQMADAGNDAVIPELRSLAGQIHPHGVTFIIQLSHCGRRATQTENDGPALGPVNGVQPSGRPVRAMTGDDIAAVVREFAKAAARCKEAGADGVQIHGAHGYLLSQFLSPHVNKRTDAYGGDIAGRSRIVFEVYDAVRAVVGPEYPVWIKINSKDLVPESSTWDEVLWVCKELDKRGINAIELSGGLAEDPNSSSGQVVRTEEEEGSFGREALALADAVKAPVLSVCGYRTPSVINDWLNRGNIAAISFCRPLLAEPGLIARWKSGDLAKSRCISCNKCFTPTKGFGCQIFR